MRMAMWDVSASDWTTNDPHEVADQVLRRGARRIDHRPARRARRQASVDRYGRRDGAAADPRRALRTRRPAAGAARRARRRPGVPVLRRHVQLTIDGSERPAGAVTDDVAGGRVARRRLSRSAWVVVLVAVPRATRSCCRPTASTTTCTSGTSHDDLWHHGRLPWHMPVLAHGDAYAYPYGFVNWTTAALVLAVVRQLGRDAVDRARCGRLHRRDVRRVPGAAARLVGGRGAREPGDRGGLALRSAVVRVGCGAAAVRDRGLAPRHGRWAAVLVGIGQAAMPAIVLPDRGRWSSLLYFRSRAVGALIRWYALCARWRCPPVARVRVTRLRRLDDRGDRLVDFFGTSAPGSDRGCAPMFFVLLRRTGRAFAPAAMFVTVLAAIAALLRNARRVVTSGNALVTAPRARPEARHVPALTELRAGRDVPGAAGAATASSVCTTYSAPAVGSTRRCSPRAWRSGASTRTAEYERLSVRPPCRLVIPYDTYDRARRTNEHEMIRPPRGPGARASSAKIEHAPGHESYAVDLSACP